MPGVFIIARPTIPRREDVALDGTRVRVRRAEVHSAVQVMLQRRARRCRRWLLCGLGACRAWRAAASRDGLLAVRARWPGTARSKCTRARRERETARKVENAAALR